MLQIFWDNGKSFNEADSVRYLFRNGKIQTEFELPENTTMLRLDPGEMSKGLKIVKLTWEDESQVKFHTDGCEVSSGEFYFGGDDPQIIVDSVPENRKSIKIEMEIPPENHRKEILESIRRAEKGNGADESGACAEESSGRSGGRQ